MQVLWLRFAGAAVGLALFMVVPPARGGEDSPPSAVGFRNGFVPFGQRPGTVERYVARGNSADVTLESHRLTLSVGGGERVDVTLRGARRDATLSGSGVLRTRSSYYFGDDPAQWHVNVPHYQRVEVAEAYPGIDHVLAAHSDGTLEWDFILHPGADVRQLRLRFAGQQRLHVNPGGDLSVDLPGGRLFLRAPVVYQERDGKQSHVDGRWVLHGLREAGFRLGPHDPWREVVIDPCLDFSSYLGGSGDEFPAGPFAVGPNGHFYIAGFTRSLDFPTRAALQPAHGPSRTDAFIAEVDPASSELVFATYFGGNGETMARALAVPETGEIYVVGDTWATDLAVVRPLQALNAGGLDAWILRLGDGGARLDFSSYLGGAGLDLAYGVAVSTLGEIALAGRTTSLDFPVASAFQRSYGGGPDDAWVAKLLPDAAGVVFSTYLGGSGPDAGGSYNGLSFTSRGEIVYFGHSGSVDHPLVRPVQPVFGGVTDGVLTVFNPAGGVTFSTYWGGSAEDLIASSAVDSAGRVVIVGRTVSADFSVLDAMQSSLAGRCNGFVSVLDPISTPPVVVWSTYLGGAGCDYAQSVALGSAGGEIWVAGSTDSADFPVLDALQAYAGVRDAFVSELSPTGDRLLFSTFLGGSGAETDASIVERGGVIAVYGRTEGGFPLVRPFQPAFGGGNYDVFVSRLGGPVAAVPRVSACDGAPVVLDGSASTGCPLVDYLYRWVKGSTELCGWTPAPDCLLPRAEPDIYTLEVACASDPGCMSRANVEVSILPDDVPGDQGNVLLAARLGTDVALYFAGAAAPSWRLYRDTNKTVLATTAITPDALAPTFTDPRAVLPPPSLWFYRVRGLSPCTLTPGP